MTGGRFAVWPHNSCLFLTVLLAVQASWCHSQIARIKIGVNHTGMQQVTGADLAAAGVDLTQLSPDSAALTCGGDPVAYRVRDLDGGRFSQATSLVFYGEALDTRYTDTNVYWLTVGGAPGIRMRKLELPAGSEIELPSFRSRTHIEENRQHAFFLAAPDPKDIDPWFWQAFSPEEPCHIPLALPHMAASDTPVRISVAVRGRTWRSEIERDHHVTVSLGGRLLGEAWFEDQEAALVQAQVEAAALRDGDVTLVVACPGDTEIGSSEQVYLDWLEVEYDRLFVADQHRLDFRLLAGAAGTAQVAGLSGPTADVYNITSPGSPLSAEVQSIDGHVELSLEAPQERRFVVVDDEGYRSPAFVAPAREPYLRADERAADLVLIAFDGFLPAIQPLVDHRRGQGLRVEAIPVSQVYDEFSHGVFSPEAIRDFLAHAYREWQRPAPAHVLLVGDANHDYRDYLGTGRPNFVPTCQVHVGGSISTATDAYFVCVDGKDHVPDMAIGRLPIATAEEAACVVDKILRYEALEPGPWQQRILFVADHEGTEDVPGKYEDVCASLSRLAGEQGLESDVLRLRAVDPALPGNERTELVREKLTPKLLETFSHGAAVIEFQGHGNEKFWSRQKILTLDDVAALTPSVGLPLCIDISCFTGWFDKPDVRDGHSLAEALLLSPRGGAIACIAPSRLGGLNLDGRLVPLLLAERDGPIGTILRDARRSFLASQDAEVWDAVENYNLLGDPCLRLRWPQRAAAKVEDDVRQPRGRWWEDESEQTAERRQARQMRVLGAPRIDESRPAGYLHLPGGRIDTRGEYAYTPGDLPEGTDSTYLFAVQFTEDGAEGGRKALAELGLQSLADIEERAAVLSLSPAQADALSSRPEVQWLGRMVPRWKVAGPIASRLLARESGGLAVRLVCAAANAEGVSADIRKAGGQIGETTQDGPVARVAAVLPPQLVFVLARDERVVSITSAETLGQSGREGVSPE